MKTTTVRKSIKQTAKSRPATPLTRIEYVNARATSVFVAGTFNDWHPKVTEMLKVGNGRWAKELTLAAGSYEYRLVVDGQWMADPAGPDSVPNPFGGRNSVLTVPG
jgi:1,4-alpha-glucan branching enzyme